MAQKMTERFLGHFFWHLCKNHPNKEWFTGMPGGNRTHNSALGGHGYIHLTTDTWFGVGAVANVKCIIYQNVRAVNIVGLFPYYSARVCVRIKQY